MSTSLSQRHFSVQKTAQASQVSATGQVPAHLGQPFLSADNACVDLWHKLFKKQDLITVQTNLFQAQISPGRNSRLESRRLQSQKEPLQAVLCQPATSLPKLCANLSTQTSGWIILTLGLEAKQQHGFLLVTQRNQFADPCMVQMLKKHWCCPTPSSAFVTRYLAVKNRLFNECHRMISILIYRCRHPYIPL